MAELSSIQNTNVNNIVATRLRQYIHNAIARAGLTLGEIGGFYTDFTNDSTTAIAGTTITLTGAGAQIVEDATIDGRGFTLDTGSTAARSVWVQSNTIVSSGRNKWYVEGYMKLGTAVDAAAIMGIGYGPAALASWAVIGGHGATSTTNFAMGGTGAHAWDSTVALDTNYHKFAFYSKGEGTKLYCRIDDGAEGSITVTPTTSACGLFVDCDNGATAAQRTITIDDVCFLHER